MPVSTLRDLCELLAEGATRAARLAVEGRSVARGTPPLWLSPASDVRVGKYKDGSLELSLSAPSIDQAIADALAQQELFARTKDKDATAVDFLISAVRDATSGNRDSDALDPGVLEVLRKSRPLFSSPDRKLLLGRAGTKQKGMLDAASFDRIDELAEETPSARVDRVVGVLDTLTVSTRTFVLKVQNAENLRGITSAANIDVFKPLLGHEVVVEGLVTYRPSGDALRIEADYIAAASKQDVLWQRRPHVDVQRRPLRSVAPGADLSGVFGKWPGDETDEELFALLEEMS